MAAVAETYAANKNAVTTLNGVSMDIMGGNFTIETSVDEMTNNNGTVGGQSWYEDVNCVNKASGSFDVAVRLATPAGTGIVTGLIYPFIYNLAGSAYLAGNVRVHKFDFKGQDVKGGTKYTINWTSQGSMTWSSSGTVTPP